MVHHRSDISDYTKDATIDLTELTDVAKVEKLIEGSGMCRQGGQSAPEMLAVLRAACCGQLAVRAPACHYCQQHR